MDALAPAASSASIASSCEKASPSSLSSLALPPTLSYFPSRASSTLDRLAELKEARLSEEALHLEQKRRRKRDQGARFWLLLSALCVTCFLAALDFTAVSTALPEIAATFESGDYSWVGSAYALTSTALIPWTGGLAFIFGRRPVMLVSLLVFVVGSAITGAGTSMSMVIAGRAIEGMGGEQTEIVVVDLVPIAERGAYFGILGAVWALASAIGPPVGGALASAGAWRWLFYLNVPLSGIAMVLVILFLDVKSPRTTMREKLEQMDYVNTLFVASSTATILAITWGGVTYSWSSFHVLVPLVLGLVGMGVFLFLEKTFVKYPTVPFDILRDRTSLTGYLTTFLHGITVMAGVYFIPVYFQSCFGDSPIQSGVHLFSLSFVCAPLAIVTGVSIAATGHYRTQNWIGWALLVVGFGCMTLLQADSGKAVWVPITVILGAGAGVLFSATNFACLAAVPIANQGHGMAFYGFIRSFGQTVGISVGSTVLQNQLNKRLPLSMVQQLGGGADGDAFAMIPAVKKLDQPWLALTRTAYADSLRVLWQVCIGITALGLLISLALKSIPLATETDEERWGMRERKVVASEEGGEGGARSV
ncbi:hypothetical protein JCM10213v2_005927 [Rhodosporidiobolus nylandii]